MNGYRESVLNFGAADGLMQWEDYPQPQRETRPLLWLSLLKEGSIRKQRLNLSFEVMLPTAPGNLSRRIDQNEWRSPSDSVSLICFALRADDRCWAV